MIIDDIKAEYLIQRKARATEKVEPLSTLLGEIQTLSKGGKGKLNDADIIAVVKKFIKNLDETIKATSERGNHTTAERLHDERKLYESFLPKQLSEQELKALIDGFISSGAKNVGDVMKMLKQNHAGTYDGAMASIILKARFA